MLLLMTCIASQRRHGHCVVSDTRKYICTICFLSIFKKPIFEFYLNFSFVSALRMCVMTADFLRCRPIAYIKALRMYINALDCAIVVLKPEHSFVMCKFRESACQAVCTHKRTCVHLESGADLWHTLLGTGQKLSFGVSRAKRG